MLRGAMITLYGFGRIFPGGVGETKDLRVQWALEETGLEYQVRALDQPAGDLDDAGYVRLNPFRQVPVLYDDGFVITESAAIVLYLAEKAGKLLPSDFQGRTRVVQWCFAAVATVEPTLTCLDLMGIFDENKAAARMHEEVPKLAHRWLEGVERRLEDREWIACSDFTVADIMMAGVLRTIRKSQLMQPLPRVRAYYERCFSRPAWERTLAQYAQRFGVGIEQIR